MKPYRIKKSNIDKKGRGLYATRDIKEGERIINYVGNIITKKQTEESKKFDNAMVKGVFPAPPKEMLPTLITVASTFVGETMFLSYK